MATKEHQEGEVYVVDS